VHFTSSVHLTRADFGLVFDETIENEEFGGRTIFHKFDVVTKKHGKSEKNLFRVNVVAAQMQGNHK